MRDAAPRPRDVAGRIPRIEGDRRIAVGCASIRFGHGRVTRMHFRHPDAALMFRAMETDPCETGSKCMTKILVIDDDPHIRRLIVRIAEDAGHEVVEAGDGREGMRLFHVHKPALVITDILMPEKDGLETIYELRRYAPEVPIIAVCGGGQLFLGFAEKFGADVTISKPFRPKELADAIGTLLKR